jgi:hypothetical protein
MTVAFLLSPSTDTTAGRQLYVTSIGAKVLMAQAGSRKR